MATQIQDFDERTDFFIEALFNIFDERQPQEMEEEQKDPDA